MRHQDAHERTELLFGINTAVLANHSANSPKTAYKPFDFMPSKFALRDKKPEKPKKFNRQKFADDVRSQLLYSGLVVNKKAD